MAGNLVGLIGLSVAPKTGGDREGKGELNQSATEGLTEPKTGGGSRKTQKGRSRT